MKSILLHNFEKYVIANLRNHKPFVLFNLAVIFISTSFLAVNLIGKVYNYNPGDISNHTIKVPCEIIYTIKDQTEQETINAKESVPLVFDRDPLVLNEKLRHTHILFESLKNLNDENNSSNLSNKYLRLQHLTRSFPEYSYFDKKVFDSITSYHNIDALRYTIIRILSDLYEEGILDKKYENSLNITNDKYIIRTVTEENEVQSARKDLIQIKTSDEIKEALPQKVRQYTGRFPQNQQNAIYYIVRSMIKPNIFFNETETKKLLTEAEANVKPVMGVLKKGQIIVREGDPVTREVVSKIEVLNKYTSRIHFNFVLGILILQLSFFLIIFLFMKNSILNASDDRKMLLIMFILCVSFFVYSYILFKSQQTNDTSQIFTLYLPIPFIVITLSLLYRISAVLISLFYTLFFTSIIAGGDYATMILSFSTAMFSLYASRSIEKRTDFLRIGLLIGLVNSILVLGIGLKDEYNLLSIAANVRLSFISGIANTIAVMGLFPLFESVFGVTSRLRLLELSDLNAPIFKKMLIKAPGTYNHSIMVANLAEAATKEINGNHLLAKVGGYFHDIGKIDNASIYIENRPDGPITDRDPHEYSREIINHVHKGVVLAQQEKLPGDVIDFILEHHGQSTMTFFYHQALEQANEIPGAIVNQSDFQYPGPKPRSGETAVVMLADAIEAASRSVSAPTYSKLEGLVKKIVHNKLNDGELENCDLTLKDITKIQKAFIRVLAGIFHTRIEYPDREDIKKLEINLGKKSE